ncbi:SURF1 family protein [Ostertagia ostertagi]
MNTATTFRHRICWLSTRTSTFAAALPKKSREDIISLDRQEGKEKQISKGGRNRGTGRNGNYKRPWASFSMLVIPAVTFGLGCWQTYRLRWKLNLIEKLKERLNEPAVAFPLDDVSQLQNMEYRRVRVTGEFLHDKEFFIAPRGRFDPGHKEKSTGSLLSSDNLSSHGAHIITPFRLSNSGLVIMINRGWVPASRISPSSRQSSQIKGIVTFDAVVRRSEARPQFMGANIPEKGTWFYKDFDQMAQQHNTAPIYLEAVYESTVPGGPIGGQSNVNVRNDHLSYLITWFSLSAVTLAMWFIRFRK